MKVRKPCSSPWCGRRVHTLPHVKEPRCQPCRRRLRELRKHRERMEARADLRDAWVERQLERLEKSMDPKCLTNAEREAVLAVLRAHDPKRDRHGAPSMADLDLSSAIEKLEAVAGRAA